MNLKFSKDDSMKNKEKIKICGAGEIEASLTNLR